MFTSSVRAITGHSVRSALASLVVGVAVAGGIVGCADVITYSQNSRAEGLKLYNQGRYTDAAGAFRNAVRQEPRDYQSQYWLGNSYAQVGSHQKAITAYRSSLDAMKITYEGLRDTEFRAKVLDALAQTIAKSDQRTTELEHLEQAAAAKPTTEQYQLVAKIYRYAGDHDMAIERYNQALHVAPTDFATLKDLGLYLEQLGAKDQALQPLRRANAVNPDDLQVADALRRNGIVPGPSLKNTDELARPRMPDGPLPDFDLHRKQRGQVTAAAGTGTTTTTTNGANGAYPIPSASVQSPRD